MMRHSCYVVELVPSNVEDLKSLLLQHGVDVTGALRIKLGITSDMDSCSYMLIKWILQLQHRDNFTRWECLGHTLRSIGHETLCLEIFGAVSDGRSGMYKAVLL
jgi:hypothetical protein